MDELTAEAISDELRCIQMNELTALAAGKEV